MKKKLFFLVAILLIVVSFSACEELIPCENCRYNVYVDGVKDNLLTYGEAEYCGSVLVVKKAAPDIIIHNKVTKFECD
jgi:hypothetical protein